jgi:hypothetical protein
MLSPRHQPTIRRASPASLRTVLAMLRRMPPAFLGTSLTHLRAERARRLRMGTAPRDQGGDQRAGFGAIHVERDAARHHLHVFFLQAGCGAAVAGVGAGAAGIQAGNGCLGGGGEFGHGWVLRGVAW